MSSKYGVYWQNKLDMIARLLREAHKNGMSNKLDVSDIQEYGERDSWYGIVEVSRGGIRKGEMAHAKSLGRTILDNRILEPYGKSEFRITIATDSRLRIERLGVGAKTTLETEYTLYPTKNEYMNNSSSQTNALILIPCCKRKKVVPIEGRIAQSLPLRNIEPLRSQLLDLVQQTSHLVDKPENHRGILSPYAPSTRSIELYKEGRFYQAADRSLRSILAGQYPSTHVLIVSAFYGLVRLDEELKEYELQMGDTLYNGTKVYKFWQQRNLSQILQGYINHNNITHVWSLLPNSAPRFPYHQVFNDLWGKLRNTQTQCFHVQVPGAGSGTGQKRAEWFVRILQTNPNYLKGAPFPPEQLAGIPGYEFHYASC